MIIFYPWQNVIKKQEQDVLEKQEQKNEINKKMDQVETTDFQNFKAYFCDDNGNNIVYQNLVEIQNLISAIKQLRDENYTVDDGYCDGNCEKLENNISYALYYIEECIKNACMLHGECMNLTSYIKLFRNIVKI